MKTSVLKDYLDEWVEKYNRKSFIDTDPISIPHRFTQKEDIEISGFLTAIIAWGNRKSIITNASRMMELLDNAPHDFVLHHSKRDLVRLNSFVHRTFNGYDLIVFIKNLQRIYNEYGGLEKLFSTYQTHESLQGAISQFKKVFFQNQENIRSAKHISDPEKNSAAKRINMYLRWMVRKDQNGVDFGIWKSIPMSILSCPLDVHSGRVAREIGLLSRKQNDAKALYELDKELRKLDKDDPVRYDYALFGMGVFEKKNLLL